MWPWAPSDTSLENICGSVCHQQWADSDGDGQSDGAERLAGTSPTNSNDMFTDSDNDGFLEDYYRIWLKDIDSSINGYSNERLDYLETPLIQLNENNYELTVVGLSLIHI